MAKHLKVKDLIKKLEKMPPDAKVTIYNTDGYIPGMYYVTNVKLWDRWIDTNEPFTGEIHVELESNYKSIAEGWED